jgi:adenosylmethionine---8-amino-7-oxononanoate aminotransferase
MTSIPPINPAYANPPAWLKESAPHVWLPYAQMQTVPMTLPAVKTEGVRVTLEDGRELIDGVSSWWTAAHGYNHPHIRQAVSKQLEEMPHIMLGGFAHEQAFRLARRLAKILPGDLAHTFFSESGSVSVEIAMKIAIQFWINQGITGRRHFVSFRGGYHGDTLGTMAVCDPDEGMHTLFKGVIPEHLLTDIPRGAEAEEVFDKFLGEHAHEVAAVVTEPLVQGAGGMLFHSAETLQILRRVCDRHNVLLIIDEIFTGFGRTGTMFACDRAGIVPDILTLSKALTGGTMALATTTARPHIFEAFLSDDPAKALMHGPTYTGNPLACAAANASLDLFEQEPRLDQASKIEAQLIRELEPAREVTGVRDVRVLGAIGVIEVDDLKDTEWLKRRFIEEGVWVRPFAKVIYTTPPLVIDPADLSQLTAAMLKILGEWTKM